jgi:hypothetical protein
MTELRGYHIYDHSVPQQDVDDLIFDGDIDCGHVSQR